MQLAPYSFPMIFRFLRLVSLPGLLGALVGSSAAGAPDLGRYQIILDKQLLGAEKSAPPPVNNVPPVQAPPSWSRDYRMTMITQDGDQVRVGLQNLRDQSAVLLIEGENDYPDFQLVSADFQQGTAMIRYRGVESRFTIEAGPAAVPSVQKSPVPARSVRNNRPQLTFPRAVQPGTLQPVPQELSGESTPRVRQFRNREELEAHLQQQQMDAIRTGKPPLPIPLTPQMDDQLVREGVLPPRN
ncbi:MAG: hypothetical protein ACO3N7_02905 [Kiritimatiellia bacterium]